ncbi:MAG: sulfite exporter TauE/SafE family protein [Clostridia bacterium]|nr:sulfite exporter TauE/SafE family protein [Clostridia bacterium]
MPKKHISHKTSIAIGAGAGLLNGLFGAGGGLLLVPLLTARCHLPPKTAFATSLVVTWPLSIVTLIVFAVRGSLDLAAALPYAVGGAIGGAIAGRLMGRVDVTWLRWIFVAFLFYGGIKAVMLW